VAFLAHIAELFERAINEHKSIYGSELQSEVHYAMPVKNGQYDMMNYAAQVEKKAQQNRAEKNLKSGAEYLSGLRKGDKLIPVITIVIYTGTEPWDGPLRLHDMLKFRDEEQKAFVPDYPLNIISAADLDDSEFTKFHTEIGYALKLLKHSGTDADKVIEERKHEKVSPETAFFLKGAANLDLDFEIEDGGVDMCASLERKYKEKEQFGQQQGEQNATKVINYLWKNGRGEEAERAEREPDFLDKLLKEIMPVLTPVK